jgi:hypothetical protein
MHGQCDLIEKLVISMMQQVMTSFEHLFNNQGIGITSWEEVKDVVQTTMNCICEQQINWRIFAKWQRLSITLHPLLPFRIYNCNA